MLTVHDVAAAVQALDVMSLGDVLSDYNIGDTVCDSWKAVDYEHFQEDLRELVGKALDSERGEWVLSRLKTRASVAVPDLAAGEVEVWLASAHGIAGLSRDEDGEQSVQVFVWEELGL